jgi:homoserine O-acetyltransferase
MKTFLLGNDLILESGEVLASPEITYHTYGNLNSEKSNVVWACHAFTANSDVLSWWNGLFGDGCLYDPNHHFIVCANILGSCYGTTGPLSINPKTGKPYYGSFPFITIRDMVRAHILLKAHLGIEKIHTLIGGSMGGQQALEWAILEPDVIQNLVLVATNSRHSPWGIAFNEAQRMAIFADAEYGTEKPSAAANGMKAARAIAMLSYRNYQTYLLTQNDEEDRDLKLPKAAAYQQYQGEKLTLRFNAYSYVTLSKAMDAHDVSRNRGSVEEALLLIEANALLISVSSDMLFPPDEQKSLALQIPNASHASINSLYGHDGFLIETIALTRSILSFQQTIYKTKEWKQLN